MTIEELSKDIGKVDSRVSGLEQRVVAMESGMIRIEAYAHDSRHSLANHITQAEGRSMTATMAVADSMKEMERRAEAAHKSLETTMSSVNQKMDKLVNASSSAMVKFLIWCCLLLGTGLAGIAIWVFQNVIVKQ